MARSEGGEVSVSWRAPGRVNLIGEHTDYNDGFALPFAIEQGCTAVVERRADRRIVVSSRQQASSVDRAVDELRPGITGWAGYALGVVWALRDQGTDVPGLTIELDSDVPIGSGLSSSAALVCSVATAVDDLLGLGLDAEQLLALTRRTENDFVGAPTGGMDQLAALRGTAGSALFCDMRSLATETVPLALTDLALLVVDTRAEHQHASGEYRRRRAGCEEAARRLGVRALRDVSLEQLPQALDRLDDDELRRFVRHVVTEDERVLHTVELLRAGDTAAIGPLLTASQASMRDDFRITIAELDVAADTLVEAGALGARMTGGGFGGCVIGLVPEALVDGAVAAVTDAYARHGFRPPAAFRATPSAGAHRVAE
jgi:galactokinase